MPDTPESMGIVAGPGRVEEAKASHVAYAHDLLAAAMAKPAPARATPADARRCLDRTLADLEQIHRANARTVAAIETHEASHEH